MPLQRGCQQPGRVHRYSLHFYSHCRCLPSLKHQTHRLLFWFKGTEQCHVLLCPGGGAALQMILGHLELSFSIVYSDPLSIFTYSQLYFSRLNVNHENFCHIVFCKATRVCTHSTPGCAEITRHGPLLILSTQDSIFPLLTSITLNNLLSEIFPRASHLWSSAFIF